jgi:hypothetical protein
MTRDQIVAQIQLLLGHRTDMTNTITAQIAIQQVHLEREVQWSIYPHFLLTERSDSFLVLNDERLPKPPDFISECEEDALWIIDSEGTEKILYKTEYNKLRLEFGNEDPGLPEKYATLGDYWRVLPEPDFAYNVKTVYYQQDAIMVNGTDQNRWAKYAPNLLIGRVGLFISGAGNNTRRDMFSALYQESKSAIERKSFDEQTVNRQYAMGENF